MNPSLSLGLATRLSTTKTPKRQSGTTPARRVTDMATIRRRGRSWHVQVRQWLPALTRSFSRRSNAELSARQRETEIDRGDLPLNSRELRSHIADLQFTILKRFRGSIDPDKSGGCGGGRPLPQRAAYASRLSDLEMISTCGPNLSSDSKVIVAIFVGVALHHAPPAPAKPMAAWCL